jgi:hypothetical protein
MADASDIPDSWAWKPFTGYLAGRIVKNDGNVFAVRVDHVSGDEFDESKFIDLGLLTRDLYVGDGFTWSGALIDAVKEMTAEERSEWTKTHPRVAQMMISAITNPS